MKDIILHICQKSKPAPNMLIIPPFSSRYPLCLLFLSPPVRRVFHQCNDTLAMASHINNTRLSDTRPHDPTRLRIHRIHNVLPYGYYLLIMLLINSISHYQLLTHILIHRVVRYASFSIRTPTRRISFPFGFSRASRNGSMRRNTSV